MYSRNNRRNSSVELFRILATIMVVIVHYNGWLAGGMPDHFDLSGVTFTSKRYEIINQWPWTECSNM